MIWETDIFLLTLTLALFLGCLFVQKKTKWVILNPILLTIFLLIAFLKATNISYETYEGASKAIAFLLKPAIVALAIPLYEQLSDIKKDVLPIVISQIVACIIGVFSASGIAYLLGATSDVYISLAPKSVTTPIAMEVSKMTGGISSLTAIIVILTGIIGAIIGFHFFKLVGITNEKAQGLAMGAAAHAVGTSQAMEKSPQIGVYSSMGLILNGALTGLLTPYLLLFFKLFS